MKPRQPRSHARRACGKDGLQPATARVAGLGRAGGHDFWGGPVPSDMMIQLSQPLPRPAEVKYPSAENGNGFAASASAHLLALARPDEKTPQVRELLPFLIPCLRADRPFVVLEPHNDDAVFKCGAAISDIVELGFPVEHIVLYSGERSPGWPRRIRDAKTKRLIRDDELRLMARILGTRATGLYLASYNHDYLYTDEEVETGCALLDERNPGAALCPGGDDLHVAHRVERSYLADCLLRVGHDLPVISYPAVWGALLPNLLHLFYQDAADVKDLACRAHPSQELAANYPAHARLMDRAWLAVAGQLLGGHHAGVQSAISSGVVGVELFRVDQYDAGAPRLDDPIVVVKGLLAGKLSPREFTCNGRVLAGGNGAHKTVSNGDRSISPKRPR